MTNKSPSQPYTQLQISFWNQGPIGQKVREFRNIKTTSLQFVAHIDQCRKTDPSNRFEIERV